MQSKVVMMNWSEAVMNWSEAVESRFVQNEPNFLTSSQSVGCKIPLVVGIEFIDENGGGPSVRLRKSPKQRR